MILIALMCARIALVLLTLRLMTTRIFFLYYFLRDQNSQDLLAVNASAFSFVLCFKAIDYTGASNYVISAN